MTSPNTRLALVAAEWFDGETRQQGGPTTFLVETGVITGIDSGDHGDALALQGWTVQRTAFVMPGLVDAHVHLFLDGATTDQTVRSAHIKQSVDQLLEAARRSARQNLASGITLVRDAGDRHGINNRVRQEALDGDTTLCRVRSGGLGIKRAKRYGAFMASDVDDAASIRQSVKALAQHNDEIKLILTGIINFEAGAVTDEPQFDAEAARLVVNTAHESGRKVFAHCSGLKGLQVAVAAGVDCIEHGFFMQRDVLAVMRDKGLAWTPTFCPVHFQWAHPQYAGWSAPTVANLRSILDQHAEQLRLAHELGVTVLLGTDAGSMGVPHGAALYQEMQRFLEASIPLAEVLKAASSAPRRHFGLAQSRLEVGCQWDAISFDKSPFLDATVLQNPAHVWLQGSAVHSGQ